MTTTERQPRGLAIPPAPRADRWVATCWYLLFFNALGFLGASQLGIPQQTGQSLTQGALWLAFAIAVVRNPRVRVRPNVLLLLMSLLVLTAGGSVLRLEGGLGSFFRLGRFAAFVSVLWLLSPAMRDGMQFVRHHLRTLCAVLVVVVGGLLVAPGPAMSGAAGGRLQSVLWPIQTTQVGQYAAVVVGLTTLLAINRMIDARTAAVVLSASLTILVLTQSRTAAVAMIVGLAVALAGQASVSTRARRLLAWSLGIGAFAAMTLMPILRRIAARGQDPELLASLTGRKKTWTNLLLEERSPVEHWLGQGLGDKSYGGLPIDSTWLSAYHEQGFVGVVIVAILYAAMLILVLVRPVSPGRTCALFLIVYAAVASYAETGVGDASVYLLHLYVAAAALIGADATGQRRALRWYGR